MEKNELDIEIKKLIISCLELEDIDVEDIQTDAPLFGEGLGLDSIDALELGLALKKKFQISFETNKSEHKNNFYSVATLREYIISHSQNIEKN